MFGRVPTWLWAHKHDMKALAASRPWSSLNPAEHPLRYRLFLSMWAPELGPIYTAPLNVAPRVSEPNTAREHRRKMSLIYEPGKHDVFELSVSRQREAEK